MPRSQPARRRLSSRCSFSLPPLADMWAPPVRFIFNLWPLGRNHRFPVCPAPAPLAHTGSARRVTTPTPALLSRARTRRRARPPTPAPLSRAVPARPRRKYRRASTWPRRPRLAALPRPPTPAHPRRPRHRAHADPARSHSDAPSRPPACTGTDHLSRPRLPTAAAPPRPGPARIGHAHHALVRLAENIGESIGGIRERQ